jgi:hypothetical protein
LTVTPTGRSVHAVEEEVQLRSEPKNPDEEPEELSLQEETLEDLEVQGGDDVAGGRINVDGRRAGISPVRIAGETEEAGCASGPCGSGGCGTAVSTPETSCNFCSGQCSI